MSLPPFGIIFPKFPMTTTVVQVDETHFSCKIPAQSPDMFQEFLLVLFQPVQPETGLSVYILMPNTAQWQFMGYVCNEKPSELIKLQPLSPFPIINGVIELGLALEPKLRLNTLTPPPPTEIFNEFAKKMATNLFNYVQSFEKEVPNVPGYVMTPRNVLQGWFEKYMTRLSKDPNFWRT
eukprot:c12570_g1_i1.p1 GENE.c12570_g1_i1~~c12570_g1_i1.p1  ORF type:complete len:179 (+),score=79.66 c12570_g1_i1:24-560(+)